MVSLRYEDYTVAWIAVLPIEAVAARLAFDNEHDGHFPITNSDDYIYIGGDLNGHKIVLATLPEGHNYGVGSAAALASQVKIRFSSLRFALLVGVAAGVPNLSPSPPQKPRDIRLGDVIVCVPDKGSVGVVQYDLGADTEHGFLINGRLAETPAIVRAAIRDIKIRKIKPFKHGNLFSTYLKTLWEKAIEAEIEEDFSYPKHAKDQLYENLSEAGVYVQKLALRPPRDENCRTHVWYGRIGSGNSLMRNAKRRDELRDEYNLIGLEMEAAGVMNTLPTGVIRGVCDYGDAQKNKEWQPYAAAVAAVYAKGVLCAISPEATKVREANQQSESKVLFDQPRPRDLNFVGRQGIIADIDDKFKTGQRVALTGIGGVGKSQIAIEYSYKFAESHPEGCVFWMFAASVLNVSEAFKDIARKLKLPGCEDPQVSAPQIVYDWLSCKDHNDWLLILDNLDDEDVFSPQVSSDPVPPNQHYANLSKYLPQTRGMILITSRNRKAAFQLTNSAGLIIDVPRMEQEDAKTLLDSKLPSDRSDDVDRTALVKALEYLPLAITQAAAYISAKNLRMTISKYLKLFQQNTENQVKLLQDNMLDLRRDSSVPNSVITTWEISFEQIKNTSPKAAELLSLMSVLDRQGIPEFLFRDEEGCLDFEAHLSLLLDFSFITSEIDGESFVMHRLVQLATRTWLKRHGKLEKFNKEAIVLLSRSFPMGTHENWKICAVLFPHAEIVLGYECSDQLHLLQKAEILANTAAYIWLYQGNHVLAEERCQQALDVRLKFLTQKDPAILQNFNLQAMIALEQGKYVEAEALSRQVLSISQEVLGPLQPNTLTTMNNLAMVLESQGKLIEAEALNCQVLSINQEVLGPVHPNTLTTMNNLAMVLDGQGKYAEAEALNRQVLSIKQEVLGIVHPETLTTMNNLAMVLHNQGKYVEAEALNRQTLSLSQEFIGTVHPRTLTTMSNLAMALYKQGKYVEAEALNRQVLSISQEVLGPEHPDTLTTMNNLATVLNSQGKYTEGEVLHCQTLSIRQKVLGTVHPRTLTTMSNLAMARYKQGKYAEAEALNRQVLSISQEVLGPEHPDTLMTMSNLATALNNQGKNAEAEALNRQVLSIRQNVLGPEHPAMLTTMNNLATVLQSQGKYTEAEALNRQVLSISQEVLGPNHHNTLTTMSNLASVLDSQSKYAEAEILHRQTLSIKQEMLDPEHPETLYSAYRLAHNLRKQKRSGESTVLYERASTGLKNCLGPDHPWTVACLEDQSALLAEIEAASQQKTE